MGTILDAFENAKAAKLYDAVEHCSGNKRRAYAMVNELEYFASLCVPYFYGRNDYYPFTRPQLEEYDKVGFQMLEEVWGILKKERTSGRIPKEAMSNSIELEAISNETKKEESNILELPMSVGTEKETTLNTVKKETLLTSMEKEVTVD